MLSDCRADRLLGFVLANKSLHWCAVEFEASSIQALYWISSYCTPLNPVFPEAVEKKTF